jgi:putative restriction endonuclease
VKYWIGVTDNSWFEFLRAARPDSVNFWHPSAKTPFRDLPEGAPFLFKLKSPHNHIGGGGFFVRYTTLPLSKAWEVFEQGNGAATRSAFAASARRLGKRDELDPTIGCSVLTQPFFWDDADWIRFPEWPRQNVRGAYYDSTKDVGKRIWEEVELRLAGGAMVAAEPAGVDGARRGAARLVEPRLGQGAFRAVVIDAYKRKCAITGESTLPVLEAAHIRPFAENGPNRASVTPELKVLVSPRIEQAWYNGKVGASNRPNPEFLRWHNENRFAA